MLTARDLWPHVRGMISLCHDDPDQTALKDLFSHAAPIVAPKMEMPRELEEMHIAPGRVAVLPFEGP